MLSRTRVSKFVAVNIFNNVVLNSTMNATINSTNNDKEIFQILIKIDDFVQILTKNDDLSNFGQN